MKLTTNTLIDKTTHAKLQSD